MKFLVQKKTKAVPRTDADFLLAKEFAQKASQELKDLLKAAVLFGSVARKDSSVSEPDIDVLLLIDDLVAVLSQEVVTAYRVIVEKLASQVSKRLHITTMKLTNFWDYVRNADPVAVNMLRDGYPLYDTGIFEPVQQLLYDGRIKPTRESIYTYFARAPLTLTNADNHVMQASVDLYWAVIDAAYAALMSRGEVPPSPGHVADLLDQRLVSQGNLHKKYVQTMRSFFDLNKDIMHRKVQNVTGKQFDDYRTRAREFIDEMKRIVEREV